MAGEIPVVHDPYLKKSVASFEMPIGTFTMFLTRRWFGRIGELARLLLKMSKTVKSGLITANSNYKNYRHDLQLSLAKILMSAICGGCGGFICVFKFRTHCVLN
jgi:hypothetical protein